MKRIRLPVGWRPQVLLKTGHLKWSVPLNNLKETDGKAMEIELPSEEQIIADEIEEANLSQFPENGEFLGYIYDQAQLFEKKKINRWKKAQNNSKRRRTKEQFPQKLKDKVSEFLVRYATMKSDAVTDIQKKELLEFVEDNRNKLYHQLKKFRGNGYSEVDTLLKILTEKPSV